MRRRFLVAELMPVANPLPDDSPSSTSPAEVSNELTNSRIGFLDACTRRHWQFNELRRAHYATMMILAYLGGRPA